MDKRQKRFRSIKTKLVVYFCLLFISLMIVIEFLEKTGIPLTNLTGELGHIRTEAFDSLNLIADLKKERLKRWIEERHDDTHVTAENEFTISSTKALSNLFQRLMAEGETDGELWDRLSREKLYTGLVQYLDKIRRSYGVYDRIRIADAKTGLIFISTDKNDLGTDVSPRTYFTGALQQPDVYTGGIDLNQRPRSHGLHFSRAIYDKNNEAAAILIMEINTEDIFKPMLHTGDSLGERGEALLVDKEVRILTSLKHPLADGTIARPIEYQIDAKPAVNAARGEEGIIETEDYRGVAVLAAYRYIPVSSEWGWGMVVKRDKEELLAPIWENMALSFYVSLVGIIVFILVSMAMAKRLTNPIMSLSQTAGKVAQGNLSARSEVTTSDEVGSLATTFNSMIGRIEHLHEDLEEEVKTRTAELEKTNRTLMLEQQKLQNISNNANCGLFLLDKEVKILYANKLAEKWFGPLDSILGSYCWEIFKQDPQKECAAAKVLRTGTTCRSDINITLTAGEEKHFYTIASPVKDTDDNITQVTEIVIDITERKQAEEEIRQLNEELEQRVTARTAELEAVNRELEDFAHIVSHDLKAPLRGINHLSSFLLEDHAEKLGEEGRELTNLLANRTLRMHNLIDGVLRYSKVGSTNEKKEKIDLNKLVGNLIDTLAPPDNIDIVVENNLPEIIFERTRIQQLFQNLMSNALKFIDKPRGEIKIKYIDDGLHYKFGVIDNGPGIDRKHQEKIFQMFRTLTSRDSLESTGVGLTIAKKIVELYNGRIWVESQVGIGSTFFFTLPKPVSIT